MKEPKDPLMRIAELLECGGQITVYFDARETDEAIRRVGDALEDVARGIHRIATALEHRQSQEDLE